MIRKVFSLSFSLSFFLCLHAADNGFNQALDLSNAQNIKRHVTRSQFSEEFLSRVEKKDRDAIKHLNSMAKKAVEGDKNAEKAFLSKIETRMTAILFPLAAENEHISQILKTCLSKHMQPEAVENLARINKFK